MFLKDSGQPTPEKGCPVEQGSGRRQEGASAAPPFPVPQLFSLWPQEVSMWPYVKGFSFFKVP